MIKSQNHNILSKILGLLLKRPYVSLAVYSVVHDSNSPISVLCSMIKNYLTLHHIL